MPFSAVGAAVAGTQSGGVGGSTAAASKTITAGNIVAVWVSWDDTGGITISSIKDDLNVNGTLLVAGYMSNGTQRVAIYVWFNHGGGARTFTATFSNGATLWRAAALQEFSGPSTAIVGGTAAADGGAGTATSFNSGNISPATTANGELILGFGVSSNQPTLAGGWTTVVHDTVTGIESSYFIQTTAGAVAASFTQSPAAIWAAIAGALLQNVAPPYAYSGALDDDTLNGCELNGAASGAAANFPVTIAATSTLSASISQSKAYLRSLSVSSTFTALVSKGIAKTLAAASTFSPAVVKAAARNRAIAATTTLAVAIARGSARSIAAATTVSASLATLRGLVRSLPVSITLSVGFARGVGRIMAVASTFAPSVVKISARARTIAATSTLTAVVKRDFGRLIAVSSGFSASLTALSARIRTIAATSALSVSLAKNAAYSRAIAATTTLAALVGRGSARSISATSTFAPDLTKSFSFGRVVAAISTFAPAISRLAGRARSIAVTSTFAVAVKRDFGKLIAVASPFTSLLSRVAFRSRTIAATSVFTPSVVRQAFRSRVLAVTSTFAPQVAAIRQIGRVIAVSSVFVAAVDYFKALPLKIIRVFFDHLGSRFRLSSKSAPSVRIGSESRARFGVDADHSAALDADSESSSTRSIERDS